MRYEGWYRDHSPRICGGHSCSRFAVDSMSTYRTIILIHKKPDDSGPFGPWTRVGDVVQVYGKDALVCLGNAEEEARDFATETKDDGSDDETEEIEDPRVRSAMGR